MITIDGSHGEGGGQILRTALALSVVTGKPFTLTNVRANRAKPGLRRQHLTCVEAAAALCDAELVGATLGSRQLTFTPRTDATAPELGFDIGTAGSTTLVVQTVLLPAILRRRPLRLTVRGGTHNPMAPTFDFLDRVFAPLLRAMGARLTLTLVRHGFVGGGAGGGDKRAFYDVPAADRGELVVEVDAGGALAPLELVETLPVTARHAAAVIARLPTHVADRELATVRRRLGWSTVECETRAIASAATSNVLLLEVERGPVRELVTVLGEKGLRAETVAERACDELEAYLRAEVPVGAHLADQLLLPLALAGGGAFHAAPLSSHAVTNIATIRAFLDVAITVEPVGAAERVRVG